MADVKLQIAGRPYDVHCADGQENQLTQLAAIVDAKARAVQGGTEVRQLLFAALMLADEAHEAQNKAGHAEPQLDSLRAAVALAESRETAAQDELRAAKAEAKASAEREQTALAELESLKQRANTAAPVAPPAHDRALLQIADRIEALADKFEQMG